SFVFAPNNSIVNYFPLDYHIPQLIMWSLRVERQIGREWVGSVAYIGNKGSALPISMQQNPANYIPGSSALANTQQLRIYPIHSAITFTDPGGNSEYHALQLNVEKRFSHGLTLLSNYTFSKTLDNLSGTNPFTRRFEHSLSQNDIPNNFKLSAVWQVPRPKTNPLLGKLLHGWALNPLLTPQKRLPLSRY